MKNLLAVFSAVAASLTIAACGGGGAGGTGGSSGGGTVTPTALTTTLPSASVLRVGEASVEYKISGGTPPYEVISSNPSVATVGKNGSAFILTGQGTGTAEISISDTKGTPVLKGTVSVGTGVALATTAPSVGVTLPVGPSSAQTYQISGGTAPYTVTSSKIGIVTAVMSGTSAFTLTGISNGSAVVEIADKGATQKVQIPVTVAAGTVAELFTSAPSALNVDKGQTRTFVIGGGSGTYYASSSNATYVLASVSGNVLTVTGTGEGDASVLITDSAGNALSPIAVTSGGTLKIASGSSTAKIPVGATMTLLVTGGSGSYSSVLANFPDTFTASLAGNIITIVATKGDATNATVTVTDSLGNHASYSFDIEGAMVPGQIVLSPVAAAISEGSRVGIQMYITGGTGPYVSYSSNEALLTVTPPGGSPATFAAVPTGAVIDKDREVIVTVVDAKGQTATSLIKIFNN